MTRRCAVSAAAALVGLALLAGCGSSDASVKASLLRGLEQIRGSQSAEKLHGQLVHTLASLRHERASTAAGRRGRRLAIEGFAATLQGIDAQLDLIANDSGNLEAAVRDAAKADRYRKRGANLLRAAGLVFGVSVGKLNGY